MDLALCSGERTRIRRTPLQKLWRVFEVCERHKNRRKKVPQHHVTNLNACVARMSRQRRARRRYVLRAAGRQPSRVLANRLPSLRADPEVEPQVVRQRPPLTIHSRRR